LGEPRVLLSLLAILDDVLIGFLADAVVPLLVITVGGYLGGRSRRSSGIGFYNGGLRSTYAPTA